ncbi:MAG: hypothetical protein MJ180_03310 [Candidatus Gastranaerophilales bacterium]|nr:hypothetical protein [Candidatus Gastranaerophilales bacterium]
METNKVNFVSNSIDGTMFDYSKCKSEQETFSIFFHNEKVLSKYMPESAKFTYPEQKGLPFCIDMTNKERNDEIERLSNLLLNGTKINYDKKSNLLQSFILLSLQKLMAKYDKGSDEVDGHIGTFYQMGCDCWLLAAIETLSDDEVSSMIDKSDAPNSYKVTFPGDVVNCFGTSLKDGEHTVIVTKDELDSDKITLKDDEGHVGTSGLCVGDKDAKLIEIAALKIINEYYPDFEYKTKGKDDEYSNWSGKPHLSYDLFKTKNYYSATTNEFNEADIPQMVGQPIGIDKYKGNLPVFGKHAYMVKSYDGEYIKLINPHCNSLDVKIKKEDFKTLPVVELKEAGFTQWLWTWGVRLGIANCSDGEDEN